MAPLKALRLGIDDLGSISSRFRLLDVLREGIALDDRSIDDVDTSDKNSKGLGADPKVDLADRHAGPDEKVDQAV